MSCVAMKRFLFSWCSKQNGKLRKKPVDETRAPTIDHSAEHQSTMECPVPRRVKQSKIDQNFGKLNKASLTLTRSEFSIENFDSCYISQHSNSNDAISSRFAVSSSFGVVLIINSSFNYFRFYLLQQIPPTASRVESTPQAMPLASIENISFQHYVVLHP